MENSMRHWNQSFRPTCAALGLFIALWASPFDTAADESSKPAAPAPDLPESAVPGQSTGTEPPPHSQTPARAPEAMPSVPASRFGMPLAFTLRGGVSLGAFEAGYLFYLAEALKRNPNLFDPRLVTGASAGSINAVLFALALGSKPQESPQDSALYRVWTTLRQDKLLDTGNPNTPMGALSSGEALLAAAEIVWQEWQKGLDESFEIVIGLSTTRLDPHEIEVVQGFSLPRQSEKFVFRIRGKGFGRPPEITNYVHVKKGLSQAMLPFETPSQNKSADETSKKDRRNFEKLRDVLMASAAFPVGFPPRRLNYCIVPVDGHTTGNECTKATESELFVDGGVFDNNPLRTAHRIATKLSRDEKGKLVRITETETEPEPYLYTYLDPDHTSYPPLPKKKGQKTKIVESPDQDKDRDVDVLKLVSGFLGTFIASARAAELYALIEEYPEVRKFMKLTTTDFPLISNELGAFFGFFDSEFLKHDFYLGIYSARNYVVRTVERYIKGYTDKSIVKGFKSATLPETSKAITSQWAPLFCMRSWFDGENDLRPACDDPPDAEASRKRGGPDMKAFRILMQISLDRLYNHCSMLKNQGTDHRNCEAAMTYQGRPPQVVRPKTAQADGYWKQCRVCKKTKDRCTRKRAEQEKCVCECSGKKEDEDSFSYTLRLLSLYGFHFRDLKLSADESDEAALAIRRRMLVLLKAFSDKHSRSTKVPLLLLGKSAVNFVKYDSPDHIIYLSFWSSGELGWSGAFKQTRKLRFAASLFQIRGVLDVFTTKTVAFVPTFGLEGEVWPISSPLFQLRIGVRLGYQLSTQGGFTDTSCEEDEKSSSTIYCSFPLAQGMVVASFYDRVRFHIGVEWTPPWFDGIPPSKNHWVTIIAGLGWQWISPFRGK